MGELKQGKSGAWFERVGDEWFEVAPAPQSIEDASLDQATPAATLGPIASNTQPGPGRAGKEQVARGVAGFAGSLLDAGQWVGRKVDSGIQSVLGLAGMEGNALPEQDGPSYNERFVNALGVGPPNTFAGGIGERVGASLPMTVATGGGNIVRNVIQDVAGSITSQYAQEKGAGPIGQAAAGILGAMLVPTRMPFASRPIGGSTVAQAGADAASQAGQSAVAPALRDLSDSEVGRLAKELKMKPDNVRAVAQYLRERIAIDPATGQPKIDEFLATIDEADRLFAGGVMPPLGNVVGDVGGQNILGVQKSILDENAIANSRATGIHQAIVNDLTDRWERLIPRWDTDSALADFATLEESRRLAKSAAWDAVPFDQIPKRPSAPIKGLLANLKESRPLMYAKLPSETRNFIEGLGDEVSLRDLQDLKADLGNIIEAGRGFGVDPKYRTVAEVASRILGKVRSEIAELPDSGTEAYNAAVKSTRDYYELFDPSMKTVSAFTKYGDKEKIVSEVLKSTNPVDEIDNLRRVFGQTPDGMEKVQSIFMRNLIGDNLGDKPIGTIMRELNKEGRSAFYQKLLGPEKYRATMDILKGYRIGTAYDIGSASALLKTGSKTPSIKRLAAFVSNARHPIDGIKRYSERASNEIAELDMAERARLIEEMIFDPTGIARRLAKIPTVGAPKSEVDGWVKNFSILKARAQTRRALASQSASIQQPIGAALDAQGRMASRAQAAARQGVSSAVVNQGGVR